VQKLRELWSTNKKVITRILTHPKCPYTKGWRGSRVQFSESFANCHCCERNFDYLNDFLLLLAAPGGLTSGSAYTSSYFFRLAFSEVPRPIALKLCHLVGIWLNVIIPLQKFGGRSPQKIWGQKHAKFWSILCHFWLWSRISPERGNVSKIGKRCKLGQCLLRLKKKSPVNFGLLTTWNYMWVWSALRLWCRNFTMIQVFYLFFADLGDHLLAVLFGLRKSKFGLRWNLTSSDNPW